MPPPFCLLWFCGKVRLKGNIYQKKQGALFTCIRDAVIKKWRVATARNSSILFLLDSSSYLGLLTILTSLRIPFIFEALFYTLSENFILFLKSLLLGFFEGALRGVLTRKYFKSQIKSQNDNIILQYYFSKKQYIFKGKSSYENKSTRERVVSRSSWGRR